MADPVRKSSAPALKDLHRLGIRAKMVTGDNRRTAEAIAAQVGVDEVVAEVLPEGKVEAVEQEKQKGLTVAMAGDGINDAPALAAADVGFAMGSGTDIAMESGDVVLVGSGVVPLVSAIKLSRATMQQNPAKSVLGLFLQLHRDPGRGARFPESDRRRSGHGVQLGIGGDQLHAAQKIQAVSVAPAPT